MKPISALLVLPLMLAACSHKEDAPLLTGSIASSDSVLVTAYYDIDGDVYIEDFSTDSTGRFTYSPSISKGTDLTLYINGTGYGVRLDNGASVSITIDSLGEATFEGDNTDESRWLNACFSGYDTRRYKHIMERDGAYDPAKYMTMIEETRQSTDALLSKIANDSLRNYYQSLGSMFYDRTKANILISDYYYNKSENGGEYPAEVETLKQVDPNADAARRTGALFEWSGQVMPSFLDNPAQAVLEACERIDSLVTNPANRRMLYNTCSEIVFNFNPSAEGLREYMAAIDSRLSDHQREVLEKRVREIESRIKDGDKIPCDPVLLTPDGTKTTLSEACGGKVAYIDMWATWCGPCCAQIPYMEKIAAHYAGNDSVVCISISCDEDLEAWHRKLDQDSPEWPQYVFSGESGQQFMTAMGVTGIPRFIVINPDMTIASIDAPRPQSDEKIKAIIDGLASK